MNKSVYLGLSIFEISKTLDHIKPRYQNDAKLCYMGTDSFMINIKTEDFYEDISNDFETGLIHRIMKSIDHCLQDNKKVIVLMKDELGGKIMTEFVALRAKTYSDLTDDDTQVKKAKGTKKCVIKK